MTTQKKSYAIYGGKAYRPCGCCDVCTDPAWAYSDCGQPVLVELDAQELAEQSSVNQTISLSEQVAELERKAAQLQVVIDKIMELQAYVDDQDQAGRALPAAVQRLINFVN